MPLPSLYDAIDAHAPPRLHILTTGTKDIIFGSRLHMVLNSQKFSVLLWGPLLEPAAFYNLVVSNDGEAHHKSSASQTGIRRTGA